MAKGLGRRNVDRTNVDKHETNSNNEPQVQEPDNSSHAKRSCQMIAIITILIALPIALLFLSTYIAKVDEITISGPIVDLSDEMNGFTMVIPVRDEEEWIAKTITYFLDSSSNHISQICLYDDASKQPLADWLLDALPNFRHKIHIIRSETPKGLMEGRVRCAELARSKYLLFMDGHCRPMSSDWSAKLFESLEGHKNRIAVPRVIDIARDSWRPKDANWKNIGTSGTKMMFDWTFEFYWQTSHTKEIPIMVGGIYAIDREYFFESGAYDEGMREWGGENIEQSIRIWSCGGEIISVDESVIGHIFDRPPKPNPNNSLVERIQLNHLRVARVWLDEFISLFFKHHYSCDRFHKNLLKTPEDEENRIESRLALKEQQQCRPFSWFVDRFRSYFDRLGLIEHDYHSLMIVPNDYWGGNINLPSPNGEILLTPPSADLTQSNPGFYASMKQNDHISGLFGYCIDANRGTFKLNRGYCRPDRNPHKGTFSDHWINSMGRRVLRVRNEIAPIGKVFDVSSFCVKPPRKAQFDPKSAKAEPSLYPCHEIEDNVIVKKSNIGDLGAIYVDVKRKAAVPSYDVYDQHGYGENETGRIIWVPHVPDTVDGRDELDRNHVEKTCFQENDACACLGSRDGETFEWIRCQRDAEDTLKFYWI